VDKLLEKLLEDYGLETLLIQNDIEELTVLEIHIERGLFDPEEYKFEDVEEDDT
jgi:hypothetical protein